MQEQCLGYVQSYFKPVVDKVNKRDTISHHLHKINVNFKESHHKKGPKIICVLNNMPIGIFYQR